MSENEEYKPHSVNAMFARILERLDQQDKSSGELNRVIFAKFEGLDKRTTKIETAMAWARGNAAAISLIVSALAWVASHFIKQP